MKRVLAVLLAVSVTASFACAGETLKVLLGQHSWTDAVKTLIPEFEKETGIKIDLEVYGDQQLSQKLTVMFASGSSDVDVFLMRPLQEARLMKKNGWCEDLTPYFKDDAEYDFADYTPGSVQATSVDGMQTSIPVMNESQLIYYRADVFKEKGVEPPKTFEELETVCEKLTDKTNDFYAFVSRGARSPLVTQFSSYLYGFGGDFFDAKAMKALIDTPEFIAAAEYYGRLLKNYGPPGALNMGWTQAIAVFQQGKGAMYIDASSQYPNLLDPAKSMVADKTGIAAFPAGPKGRKVYDITAWGISMSSRSQKKDAAWKFIRYMTDKERTTVIQGNFANQCARKSAYASEEGTKSFPADWVKVILDSAPYGVGHDRPLVTQVELARDIVGGAVTAGIEGKDVKAAAVQAQKMFQELLDKED